MTKSHFLPSQIAAEAEQLLAGTRQYLDQVVGRARELSTNVGEGHAFALLIGELEDVEEQHQVWMLAAAAFLELAQRNGSTPQVQHAE